MQLGMDGITSKKQAWSPEHLQTRRAYNGSENKFYNFYYALFYYHLISQNIFVKKN